MSPVGRGLCIALIFCCCRTQAAEPVLNLPSLQLLLEQVRRDSDMAPPQAFTEQTFLPAFGGEEPSIQSHTQTRELPAELDLPAVLPGGLCIVPGDRPINEELEDAIRDAQSTLCLVLGATAFNLRELRRHLAEIQFIPVHWPDLRRWLRRYRQSCESGTAEGGTSGRLPKHFCRASLMRELPR